MEPEHLVYKAPLLPWLKITTLIKQAGITVSLKKKKKFFFQPQNKSKPVRAEKP